MRHIVDRLRAERDLTDEEFRTLLTSDDKSGIEYLHACAREIREEIYGKAVYIRGLIEISNICKNGCYYCGINCSNPNVERYRLTKDDIMSCVEEGYGLGFRTFVLQGGEDPFFTDEVLVDIVGSIKASHPDCAVTLSVGERSEESYKALYDAGVDRYLLRHETASPEHYGKLHPDNMSWDLRMKCLRTLKSIGFQVGCGMMIDSPYQTVDDLIRDLRFIKEFHPDMCGIGPFIPHKETIFKDIPHGGLDRTLRLLSIIRLIHPDILLPSTTALGTIDPEGRELGILAGANVVMPNLSPLSVRKKYALYDNKICTDSEAAEGLNDLKERMRKIGYEVVVDRGDHKNT